MGEHLRNQQHLQYTVWHEPHVTGAPAKQHSAALVEPSLVTPSPLSGKPHGTPRSRTKRQPVNPNSAEAPELRDDLVVEGAQGVQRHRQ